MGPLSEVSPVLKVNTPVQGLFEMGLQPPNPAISVYLSIARFRSASVLKTSQQCHDYMYY